MEFINIIIGVILLIISVLVFIGKGGFLIAGFNTMNENEKEAFDVKKLSLTIGVALLVLAIAEILMGVWPIKAVVIPCFIVIAVIVLAMLIIVNKKSKTTKD